MYSDESSDDEFSETNFRSAESARASRALRSLPPSPEAEDAAWKVTTELADKLERRGLVRIVRLPVTEWNIPNPTRKCFRDSKSSKSSNGSLDSSTPLAPTASLSHVFSLQRSIDAGSREPSFLVYQAVLPLEATQLVVAAMRSNSVRASVTKKRKKTQGGGQQITRNNTSDVSSSWAAQAAVVAFAMGVGKFVCRAEGFKVSDPIATTALDPYTLVAADAGAPDDDALFVLTSTTRLLPHALPTRLCAHNLLETMRAFAVAEV